MDNFFIFVTSSSIVSLLAFGGAVRETWVLGRFRHK